MTYALRRAAPLAALLCLVLAAPAAAQGPLPRGMPFDPDEPLSLPSLAEAALVLLAIFPALYLSAIGHELGHAVLARWAGYTVTSCGSGIAQVFCRLHWRDTCFYLARRHLFQGITFVFLPCFYPSRLQILGLGLGGVLAHFVLAPAAFAVWLFWPFPLAGIWLMAACLNTMLAIGNLIPIRTRVGRFALASDGAMVLHALRAGVFAASTANVISLIATLRGLWQETGDRLIHTTYLLTAAHGWAGLGSRTRPAQLCAEAEALGATLPPPAMGLVELTRATAAMVADRQAEADAALELAEALFRQQQHAAGLFRVARTRAEALLHAGDQPGAAAAFDALAAHPTARERPGIGIELLAARIEAHAGLSGDDTIAPLRAEYESLRRRFPSPERDLRVYTALARQSVARGDLTAAEPDFARAVDAARDVHDALPNDEDRAHFRECQRPRLLDPAHDCLQQLDKVGEAERIEARFRPGAAVDEERLRTQRRRNRILFGAGAALAVIDVLIAVALFAALVARGVARPQFGFDPVEERLIALGSLFTAGVLSTAAYTAYWLIGGLLVPAWRDRRGGMALIWALTPWLLAPLILVMHLRD
jgi:hypothetical protein